MTSCMLSAKSGWIAASWLWHLLEIEVLCICSGIFGLLGLGWSRNEADMYKNVCMCYVWEKVSVAFSFTYALFCLHLLCTLCYMLLVWKVLYKVRFIDMRMTSCVQWVVLWIWHSTGTKTHSGQHPLHVWPIWCRWESVCSSNKDFLLHGEASK